MFETRKLKKAKSKLELIEVQEKLDKIESEKEKERWGKIPQWERNIETEILRDKLGQNQSERHDTVVLIILASFITIFFLGFAVSLAYFMGTPFPSTINGWIASFIVLIIFGSFIWSVVFKISMHG